MLAVLRQGFILCAFLSLCPGLEQAVAAQDAPLVVGIKEASPFSFKNPAGDWEGISVALWSDVARDAGLEYRFEERTLQGLIEGVGDGSLDAAIGALTITASRERLFDFSHAFYHTGLGVAVRSDGGRGLLGTLREVMSGDFFRVVGIILLALVVMTLLITLFERALVRREPDKGGRARNRFAESLWWTLVIMIGKNDSHPVSFGGRLLALLWMVASLFIVSGLTAVITSVLTVNELQSSLSDPSQLGQVRVLTVQGSSSEDFLSAERIGYETTSGLPEALARLAAGEADALVYDKPLLRYLVNTDYDGVLDVLSFTLEPQSYGFALISESPYLEAVNRSLLEHSQGEAWNALLFRYFGGD